MNRMTRILTALLALVLLLGVLASCTLIDTNPGGGDGGERVDGSWDGVDFGGQEVRFCISINKYNEVTFPAADTYTRGPDTAGSNEVYKEVLARNARAEEELGVKIVYTETNTATSEINEELRTIVQTSAKNSPDLYNNDSYGLSRAMVDGLLWNVTSPGEGIKSYFDFNAEGWYLEFMKGCTFDQSKMYLFAGDYFIDMIRMAWVIYVNNDILASNIAKMPAWCESVSDFYEYVADGFWDFDVLAEMSRRVFVEGVGGKYAITEREDQLVGLAVNHTTDWIFSATSNVTVYYQDKEDGYAPKVMDSIDTYQKVANKFVEMQDSLGVYWEEHVLSSTECFLQGNFLFAVSKLGEMESPELRDFSAAKGLVPTPKWDDNVQEDYHTILHDQVEIGCILNTAHAFSASSALMQFLNEESDKVVHAYYEKGLKYKYNSDKDARQMMDIVRATTDAPFGFQIGVVCQTLYTGSGTLHGMWIEENTTCASTFASEKEAYVDCMNQMIEKFKKLP